MIGGTALAAPASAGPALPGIWQVLALVWAAVALALAVRAVVNCVRLRRKVALACKTVDGCYTCESVALPFILGIFHPRIYMPARLHGAERAAIRLHERTHIRRGDTLIKPLFYAVAVLHWFNPAVWLAYRAFCREMESACDEAALRGQPFAARTQYCESIFRFATVHTAAGALSFADGGVKGRILGILQYRKPKGWVLALCTAGAALAMTACMLTPRTEAAPTPEPPAAPATGEQAQTEKTAALEKELADLKERVRTADASEKQALDDEIAEKQKQIDGAQEAFDSAADSLDQMLRTAIDANGTGFTDAQIAAGDSYQASMLAGHWG